MASMTTARNSLNLAPPEFLQLVAHPLRWRLLGELARSDRIVQELSTLVCEPQNLVSYHLAKLRDGDLVSGHRSSADRRDTYYTANLAQIRAALAASGAELHPALRLAPAQRSKPVVGAARVLFLCTGNSARSPMAEALMKVKSAGAIEAVSAGSHPKPLHINALRVMRDEQGIDLTGHAPRHFDAFAGKRFDYVISLCDRVREVCPKFPGGPEATHWSIPNPATGEPDATTYPLFQKTASDLAVRIDFLLAALAERTPASQKKRRKS